MNPLPAVLLVAFCLLTSWMHTALSKHGCPMLQALIIHGLRHWEYLLASPWLGPWLIGPSPNKAPFLNLHLCVALLETRGVNRCVNIGDEEKGDLLV